MTHQRPTRFAQYRELFPVTRHYAYLNHASSAALPTPVIESMNRYLAERSLMGSEALCAWDDEIEQVRQKCARFIGAHCDEITFTGSVSHGLNIIAAGLDWQPGDNVICAETEFPANVYPWMNLQRRGVEVRMAPARDNRILVEDVASLIDHHTRLVAVSYVEFSSGYRNDLDLLADVCHKQGVYLCVDGIQGLGALQFDVSRTPADFVATQAAKWMLGPIGAGFLYVRRERQPELEPVISGWRSVVQRDDYFCYDSPHRKSGERFEPGSLNAVGLVGLEAAIDLLLGVGIGVIEARVLALTDTLITGLQERGLTITSPIQDPRERSGIICFQHPAVPSEELAGHLHDVGVIVSVRGAVIRVSPHFYNNEADLDRLLAALPS
jgi:selenocysteine lyase/cysteine desulfurase